MTIYQRLASIDTRVIYVVMGLSVLGPILVPLNLGVAVTPPTRAAFETIEKLPPGSNVLVSFDYGPSSAPENNPMASAVLRQCMARDLKVVIIALFPVGGGSMALRQSERLASDFPGKKYGTDFVNLGYKDGGQAPMRQMAENFQVVFPADASGRPVSEIPIVREIKGYKDFALCVTFPTGIIGDYWINLVNAQFHLPIIVGPTAVGAPRYYAFFRAGQAVGLIGGLKGASEYEKLLVEAHPELGSFYGKGAGYTATKGMDAQQTAHLTVAALIIVGNVFFFLERKKRRAGPGGTA